MRATNPSGEAPAQSERAGRCAQPADAVQLAGHKLSFATASPSYGGVRGLFPGSRLCLIGRDVIMGA